MARCERGGQNPARLRATRGAGDTEPFVVLLWGRSQHRQLLLDLPSLVRCQVGQLGQSPRALLFGTTKRCMSEQMPLREVVTPVRLHTVAGAAPRKRMCARLTKCTPSNLDGLEQIAALLSKWADSIGKDRARSCAALLWLTPGSQLGDFCSSSSSEPPPSGVVVFLWMQYTDQRRSPSSSVTLSGRPRPPRGSDCLSCP